MRKTCSVYSDVTLPDLQDFPNLRSLHTVLAGSTENNMSRTGSGTSLIFRKGREPDVGAVACPGTPNSKEKHIEPEHWGAGREWVRFRFA